MNKAIIFLAIFLMTGITSMAQDKMPANNDGGIIDLLVLYTSGLSQEKGGTQKTEKWIDEMLVTLNTSMRNSKVQLRVDVVHKASVSYKPTDNTTDLKNLTAGKGGLESAHSLRDKYHADAIILFHENEKAGGRAHTIKDVNSEYVKERFMVSNEYISTFVHEFGHILGGQHDGINEQTGKQETGPYSYSHGYTGDNYTPNTTIGGYEKNRKGTGKLSNFYSNPNLYFRGAPLGTMTFSNNAMTFNQTAPYIAKNRDSEVRWTGRANKDWNKASNWSTGVVPRSIDDVVIPAGLSNYPRIGKGKQIATARNLFVEKGASLSMLGGQLNVRGHVKADGALTATNGLLVMENNFDNGQQLSLSASSYLFNLTIGGSNVHAFVKLKSKLIIKGTLTIKPWSVLDAGGQQIAVAGDWNDQSGGGFNYRYKSVKVGGQINLQQASYEFVIPVDPKGGSTFYGGPSGWFSISEKGNAGPKWSYGGKEGMAMLNSQSYQQDRAEYMDNIDAWAMTEPFPFAQGVSYSLELEYKQQVGEAHLVSLYRCIVEQDSYLV